MSFLSKVIISTPINVVFTLGLGAPIGLVPSGLGFLVPLAAGEGSDRVPVIVTSGDGTIYRDLRDPSNTWRNASDGSPVSSQRQNELDSDWQKARDELRRQIPFDAPLDIPIFSPRVSALGTNLSYQRAKNRAAARDPLVLDLDGDGIEAVGINRMSPILFDHNGDSVKTATGWISADDGFVVRDLNGNGTIDSGRELFGDNTVIDGLNHASNGYAALAALDANADGKIDSADSVFSELRIWQDENQDGISQSGELKTLSELGIASIGVVGTPSNTDLGNGNTQPWTASFTRTNGTAGTSGVAELSGSLLLASNGFYREFTDDPVIAVGAAALPQMGGSGWVRDLREAMSLGTDKAEALEDAVDAFAAATTAST